MRELGKYTNLERVGKGTMGVVYRAWDESLGEVAIKVMSADTRGNPMLRDRFVREARVAASLDHPNIIDIHGMGEHEGHPYIVMEYLDGESLAGTICRGDAVPLERRLELIRQIAAALAYAHRAGVAHRDIKPENIFVTRAGDVRLLDFGIARIKGSTMTATGVALGTPSYMAPEQVAGKKVDRRADVFGAGTVFYELLCGQRAFTARKVHDVLDKVAHHDPPPIHRVDDLLPRDLSAIVHKAMAKSPDDRYQSMDEMLAHLQRFDRSLARLHEEARVEAAARLAEGSEHRRALPEGYLELRRFIRGLAGERGGSGALMDELAMRPAPPRYPDPEATGSGEFVGRT